MRLDRLEDMVRGWFVGNFNPTSFQTNAAEVGVKHYMAGDKEEKHHHKVATEITLILSGEVKMHGRQLIAGDIAVLRPGESSDFLAVTDVTLVVVKVPGASNDKYID